MMSSFAAIDAVTSGGGGVFHHGGLHAGHSGGHHHPALAHQGFVSSTSFSSLGSPNAGVKRTSTSTKFVNGKKITTRRVFENGRETVHTYENDVLQQHTVNGVAQQLAYSR